MILRRYKKRRNNKFDLSIDLYSLIFFSKKKKKKNLDLKVRVLGCKQAVRLSGFLC